MTETFGGRYCFGHGDGSTETNVTAAVLLSGRHCDRGLTALLDAGLRQRLNLLSPYQPVAVVQRNCLRCVSGALVLTPLKHYLRFGSRLDRMIGGSDVLFGRVSHAVAHFRVFECGAGERGELDQRREDTSDGRIKAAMCGPVGRLQNAARSSTWHNVHFRTAHCRFAQPTAISRLTAHCGHSNHDPRR